MNIEEFKKVFITREEFREEISSVKEEIKNIFKIIAEIHKEMHKNNNQINSLISYNKVNDKNNEIFASIGLSLYLEKNFINYNIIKPKNAQIPRDIFSKNNKNKQLSITE